MKNLKTIMQSLVALLLLVVLSSCKNETPQDERSLVVNKEMAKIEKPTPAAMGYSIGDEATNFNLMNTDRSMVSLTDYPDALGFIIIFTCNTCPYAVASEDRIIALDAAFKDKGYPVIAINPNDPAVQPDDTFELMQKKTTEKGFTFPYLYDENDKVYAAYGATKTPHVYLLQKEADKNIVKYIGAIDDNVRRASAVKETFLANAINEIIAGKEVTVKETKAIGCSIKV
jgi:peroxiredoxin